MRETFVVLINYTASKLFQWNHFTIVLLPVRYARRPAGVFNSGTQDITHARFKLLELCQIPDQAHTIQIVE